MPARDCFGQQHVDTNQEQLQSRFESIRTTNNVILSTTLGSALATAALFGNPGSASANLVTNGAFAVTPGTASGDDVCGSATPSNPCVSRVPG